jgi:hypothetical protein
MSADQALVPGQPTFRMSDGDAIITYTILQYANVEIAQGGIW